MVLYFIKNKTTEHFLSYKYNKKVWSTQTINLQMYIVGHNGGIIIFTPIYGMILTMIYS